MFSLIPLATVCAAFVTGGEVLKWTPRQLREGIALTRLPAEVAQRFEQQGRLAGELELNGYLRDGALLFTAAAPADAKALLDWFAKTKAVVAGFAATSGSRTGAQPEPGATDLPLVAFHVDSHARYVLLVDRLAKEAAPPVATFLAGMRDVPGFTLADPPLCVAVDDGQTGRLRDRPNLLVHLLAHLMVDQAFGPQPEWLREGIALDVEAEVAGMPTAFCRSDPRPVAARSDRWKKELLELWRAAGEAELDRVLAMDDSVFDEERCLRAMALARRLREHHPDVLARLLAGVRAAAAEGVDLYGDPLGALALQQELLAAALGEEWRAVLVAELSGVARRKR